MQEQAQPAGCVLFADVSGSTKLYETVGDSAAHAAIDMCVKLFASITLRHQGRVVKTIGDEVMSVFPESTGAARAAVEMQKEMAELAPVGTVRLGVRIGLHYGALVERQGDVFGDTVNLAARLTELASRNQVITSLETADRLTPALKLDCRRLYSIPVKGKEKEVAICEMLWSEADQDERTHMVAERAVPAAVATTLRLVHRERTIRMPVERRSVVLGRDATADLVIPDKMASRAHCEIEQRQAKFVIADRSANGTWIAIDGDRAIVLRREESILRGHGFITLGQARETATEVVEFFCE